MHLSCIFNAWPVNDEKSYYSIVFKEHFIIFLNMCIYVLCSSGEK